MKSDINKFEDILDFKNYVVNLLIEKYKVDNRVNYNILFESIENVHLLKKCTFLCLYFVREFNRFFILNNINYLYKKDDITIAIGSDNTSYKNYSFKDVYYINLEIAKRKYIIKKLLNF